MFCKLLYEKFLFEYWVRNSCNLNYSHYALWFFRNNTILVGTRNSISLAINAFNDGENAYLATVDVQLPEYVQFVMIPTICELIDRNKISCTVDDPLSNTTVGRNINSLFIYIYIFVFRKESWII